MNIRIKNQTIIDENKIIDAMFAPTIKGTEKEIAKHLVNRIEEQLNFASRILELTNTKINIDKFNEIINTLYDISLSEDDYWNVFSLAYNKKFAYCIDLIYTYMVRNSRKYNGYLFVSETDVETCFKIAYSEDFKHNPNNRYTVSELKQLIKDRKIIILDEFDSELTIPEKMQERYEKFPVHRNYKNISEDNYFYPYIIAYIRKTITNEKIKSDVHEYLLNLKSRINEILLSINTSFANECQKELSKTNILTKLETLIDESLKVSPPKENKINFKILEPLYPPFILTQETIDNIKKDSELYLESSVKVSMGKVHPDKENKQRIKTDLSRPLTGKTKKRIRQKKSQKNRKTNKKDI